MPRGVGALMLVATVLFASAAACRDDDPAVPISADTPMAPVAVADPRTAATYSVALVGAAEVPGPGDPDGAGEATVMLAPGRGEVCFTLSVDGFEATGAHLHTAPAGQSGPVVLAVPLGEGCVSADEQLLVRLAKDPVAFYVNVFSDAFPEGAVRGQLGPSPPPAG